MTAPLFCLVDQNLRDLVGHHYEYDRACVKGAAARGYEAICLGHRDAIEVVAETLPLRRAFSRNMWWLPAARDRAAAIGIANAEFRGELDAALAEFTLDGSSVIFAHMIVHGQLSAWAEFVDGHCGPDGPLVVLLLRYQPSFYQDPACEKAFRSLERNVERGARLRLASDSARLSGQLERLTSLPVETFPIPHTHSAEQPKARAPGPLRVVSLGNARDEKGILELFDAALILEQRGDVELELILQVNDPNPDIAPAVERFIGAPPANTRLILEPLSSEAYAHLLASADIVATPYWRSIYEARTSGVFLEAVAAGKPVVCTADTWMADELAHAGAGIVTADQDPAALAGALAEACARFATLSARAQADRPKWMAFHNPDRLVDAVLDGVPPSPRPEERRAAVLFPWGDTLPVPASGAANRVRLVIELLATRYHRVRVLQDVDRAPVNVGRVSYETFPLLQRVEGRRWYKWAVAALRGIGVKNGEETYALLHLAPAGDPEFLARIDEIIAWADIVFLEYPFWAEVVREACDRHGKTLVLTSYDTISDQCRSSGLLRGLTRQLEKRALRRADHHIALSRDDAEVFARWGAPAIWSPIAPDVKRLSRDIPGEARALLNGLIGLPKDDQTPILLFFGTRFRPNMLAAAWIRSLSEVFAAAYPDLDVYFVIAGACHEQAQGDNFLALGFIDTLTAHLLRRCCTLVLAPLTLGTGVSVKSLEAFASGAPMLSTTVGVRGIEGAEAGAVIEDDLDAWGERLADLLRRPERRAELVQGAQRLAADMDYRRAYQVYLELGGVQSTAELRPGGPDPERELLLDAAEAASRLGLDGTVDACLAEVLDRAPGDSRALILLAQRTHHPQAKAVALQAALCSGADVVAVLKARAETAGADQQAIATLLAQAARFEVSRRMAQGGEAAVCAEAWRAYHAGERPWALALASEVVDGWPSYAQARPDYDYLCASILSENPEGDSDQIERHARRALEAEFEPFWCRLAVARAVSRRSASDAEGEQAWEAAVAAAAGDTSRHTIVVDAMVDVGWRSYASGQAAAALTVSRQALAVQPDHMGALYLGAELTNQAGEKAQALSLYQQAEAQGADPAWCATHRGELLLAFDNPQEAADAAIKALELAGGSHRRAASDVVCAAVWRLYEIADARLSETADRVLAAGITDGWIWYVKGEASARRHELLTAMGAYDRAFDAGFDAYWIFRRRAETLSRLGSEDLPDRLAAARLADTVDKRFEVLAPLLMGGGEALDAETFSSIQAAATDTPELARLLDVAANRLTARPPPALSTKISRPVQAIWQAFEAQRYEEVLARTGLILWRPQVFRQDLAHGHYLTAECLQMLRRDLPTALSHYDSALALGFDAHWVHFNRAALLTKLGESERAMIDLRKALALTDDPDRRRATEMSLRELLAHRETA